VKPSWKYRRILIYATFILGTSMIVWGAVQFANDARVLSELVIAGTALITTILTSYILGAVWDDRQPRDGGEQS
jgi:hypothetical protein